MKPGEIRETQLYWDIRSLLADNPIDSITENAEIIALAFYDQFNEIARLIAAARKVNE